MPRQLKHKLLEKKKFGFSSCAANLFIYFIYFFFFATSRKTSSQQTAKDFCLVQYLRYAGRPPPASAPRFGLTAVNTSLRCGRQSSPHPLATEGTQNGNKKKHHAPARWELECAQQPKKQSSAGQPITPCLQKKKKNDCFPLCLPGTHFSHTLTRRVCIAVVGCTSKLKHSQLFSETWCCSARQCHSWRRRFLHAARAPPPGGKKVDGIDKMFCSICERASRRSRHWFVRRGRYTCLFKTCLVVVLYGLTIGRTFERICSFFVKILIVSLISWSNIFTQTSVWASWTLCCFSENVKRKLNIFVLQTVSQTSIWMCHLRLCKVILHIIQDDYQHSIASSRKQSRTLIMSYV